MNKKKQIRLDFRYAVYLRDKGRCKICGDDNNLDPHHITDRGDMPNGGYVKENGITLCDKHHLMAEKWHSSYHTEWEDGMLPDDLYRLIGSSYELALEKSKKLN